MSRHGNVASLVKFVRPGERVTVQVGAESGTGYVGKTPEQITDNKEGLIKLCCDGGDAYAPLDAVIDAVRDAFRWHGLPITIDWKTTEQKESEK